MMRILKKALSIALTLVLLIALAAPASAAAKATAATMKLQSKSGTVTITKSTGKAVTYKAGMSLYNGYTITTGSKSYANISVDSSKVLKVDSSSSVTIKKSGKKLKLYVNSGSAFFNVPKKLSGDESMDIQTSTMTAGIRGTAGIASAGDAASSAASFMLLEGSASVSISGGVGSAASFSVGAGQSLSLTSAGASPSLVPVSASAIPAFAAVAIAADPALQARIEQAGAIPVADVIKDADTRLEQAENTKAEIIKQIEENINKEVTKPDPPAAPAAPSSGGGGGGYTPPNNYQIITDGSTPVVKESGRWDRLNAPRALNDNEYLLLTGNVGSASSPAAKYTLDGSSANGWIVLNGKSLYADIDVKVETLTLGNTGGKLDTGTYSGKVKHIDPGFKNLESYASNVTVDLGGDKMCVKVTVGKSSHFTLTGVSPSALTGYIVNSGICTLKTQVNSLGSPYEIPDESSDNAWTAAVINTGKLFVDTGAAVTAPNDKPAIINNDGATVNVKGGTVTSSSDATIENRGTLHITGGRVLNGKMPLYGSTSEIAAIKNQNVCNISGGEVAFDIPEPQVSPELQGTAAAVLNEKAKSGSVPTPTLAVSGGTISSSDIKCTDGANIPQKAVVLKEGTRLNMIGGTIENKGAESAVSCEGSGATATMEGGIITAGETSDPLTSTVNIALGTFTMNGGIIKNTGSGSAVAVPSGTLSEAGNAEKILLQKQNTSNPESAYTEAEFAFTAGVLSSAKGTPISNITNYQVDPFLGASGLAATVKDGTPCHVFGRVMAPDESTETVNIDALFDGMTSTFVNESAVPVQISNTVMLYDDCVMTKPVTVDADTGFTLVGTDTDSTEATVYPTITYTGTASPAFTLGTASASLPHKLEQLNVKSTANATLLKLREGTPAATEPVETEAVTMTATLTGVTLEGNGADDPVTASVIENPVVKISEYAKLNTASVSILEQPVIHCKIINNSASGTAVSVATDGEIHGGNLVLKVKRAATEPENLNELLNSGAGLPAKYASIFIRFLSNMALDSDLDFYTKSIGLTGGYWTFAVPVAE